MGRFVAVPRAQMTAAIAAMPGWRAIGERSLALARAACPVYSGEDDQRPRAAGTLRDSLVLHFVSGADPRIMIGSSDEVLRYITDGTEAHTVGNQGQLMRFVTGGQVVFAHGPWTVRGIKPNPFIMRSYQEAIRSAGSFA